MTPLDNVSGLVERLAIGDTVHMRRSKGWYGWAVRTAALERKTPTGQMVIGGTRFDAKGREMGTGYNGWRICLKADYDEALRDNSERNVKRKVEECAEKLNRIGNLDDEEIEARFTALSDAIASLKAISSQEKSNG